jgi:phosphoglycolate phosphatase-like HAD superfamily hydrolase
MKLAIWLDGVILKVDLTDALYTIYKGGEAKIEFTKEIFPDSIEFISKVKELGHEIVILSPYDKAKTEEIIKEIGLSDLKFISNEEGVTKPSKFPYEKLFRTTSWNPLEVITVGSSPLDLLSARFYDSRIKVVCVNRFQDCSKYSPYLMGDNLIDIFNKLKRWKKL